MGDGGTHPRRPRRHELILARDHFRAESLVADNLSDPPRYFRKWHLKRAKNAFWEVIPLADIKRFGKAPTTSLILRGITASGNCFQKPLSESESSLTTLVQTNESMPQGYVKNPQTPQWVVRSVSLPTASLILLGISARGTCSQKPFLVQARNLCHRFKRIIPRPYSG